MSDVLKETPKGDEIMSNIIDNIKPADEPFPEILTEFCKNTPHSQFDNLYLCEVVDMDGNVIETKVGKNVMTNYGLKLIFVDHNWNYDQYRHIYVGGSDEDVSTSDKELKEYFSALSYDTRVTSDMSVYPLTFDKDTNICSARYKVHQGYWNYTAGGNETFEIKEIGYGYDQYNNLMSHALIYDVEGKKSSITKKPNTRLYITLYWVASFNPKIIQEAYEKGQYALINPGCAVYRSYGPQGYLSPIYRTRLNTGSSPIDVSSSFYFTTTLDSTSQIAYGQDRMKTASWLLEPEWLYISGLLFSFNSWRMYDQYSLKDIGHFAVLTYDELPEEESVDCEHIYVNELPIPPKPDISKLLSDNFGLNRVITDIESTSWDNPQGTCPVVQYDMKTLNMYNYKTDQWDIPVKFQNAKNTYYNTAHWRMYLSTWLNYDGKSQNVYTFVNPYTNRKITKFNNSGMTICATDTYWDTNSYEEIKNLNDVGELGQKRYYVVVAGTLAELKPSYDIDDSNGDDYTGYREHAIIPKHDPFEITGTKEDGKIEILTTDTWRTSQGSPYVGSKPISSEKYKFFLTDWSLVYFSFNEETNETHLEQFELRMQTDSYGDVFRRYITKNEDRIVIFEPYRSSRYGYSNEGEYNSNTIKNTYVVSKNNFRIFKVGEENEHPIETLDMVLNFENTANTNTLHKYSWSDNGFLVVQRTEGSDEAIFVDIYAETQQTISDCKHCQALNLTDYCVYQDISITDSVGYTFKIYDMKNNQEYQSFVINDGTNYTVTGIFGWSNFVYVLVTANSIVSTYFYDISTQQLSKTTLNYDRFNTGTNNYSTMQYESNEDCMVSCYYQNGITVVFKASDPTNPIRLFDASLEDTASSYMPNYRRTSYGNHPQIKRIKRTDTDGSGKEQLILAFKSGGYSKVIDLGWVINNGPIKSYPYGFFPVIESSASSTSRCGSVTILNEGVIIQDARTDYRNHIYWFPIEYFLRLKCTGTTKTITAYNNPVVVSGKGLSIGFTNNFQNLLNIGKPEETKNGG